MEDSRIIELYFARNEDAIRHTDDTYGRQLLCLADRIVKNDQDAEESVNDTYLKAWNTIPPHISGQDLQKFCAGQAGLEVGGKAQGRGC